MHISYIRILVTAFLLAVWYSLIRAIWPPVTNLVSIKLALATVNGGDAAYVAQRSYESLYYLPVGSMGAVLIIIAIYSFKSAK